MTIFMRDITSLRSASWAKHISLPALIALTICLVSLESPSLGTFAHAKEKPCAGAQRECACADERSDVGVADCGLGQDIPKAVVDTISNKTLEFLTDWISIESLAKEAKRERVGEEARTQLVKLEKAAGFITLEQAARLNKRWQALKGKSNWETLCGFFEKATAYRDALREYAERIQQQDGARGQVEGLKEELGKFRSTVDLLKQRSANLREMQKNFGEDYLSRFANLPESVVLLGRIEIGPKDNLDTLSAVLSDVLQRRAVREKSIFPMSEILQFVPGDRIVPTYLQKDIGRADIIDTYSWVHSSRPSYKYMLSRIEVYPYEVLAPSEVSSSQPGERHPEMISRVESFRIEEASFDSLAAQHMENEMMKEFAALQLDIALESGGKMREQAQQLTDQLRAERLEYDTKLIDVEREESAVAQAIATRQWELDTLKVASQKFDRGVNEWNSVLLERKRAYDESNRRKTVLVSKSVAAKAGAGSSRSLAEFFSNLAKSTFPTAKELKQVTGKTAILTESGAGQTRISRNIKERPLTFIPEVTRFRFVSLTYDDRTGDATGFVNVAYEVRSTPEIMTLVVKGDTLFDKAGGTLWVRKTGISSANYAAEGMPAGFRQPTLEELHDLGRAALRYAETNKRHPFALLGWPLDFPYLSAQRTTNSRGQILFKSLNFQSGEEEEVLSGDGVYVLWMKPSGAADQ
jgi:hypothetical protein